MRDNGLTAPEYTSLGGISPQLATPALTALAKAGIAAYCATPTDAEDGQPSDPADGAAEAAGATPSLSKPSSAEGAAKAEVAKGADDGVEGAPAGGAAEKPVVPVGFEEIFVAAQAVVRARAVIARSSEDAEWASLVEQFNAPSAEGHAATPVPRWPASEDVEEGSYEPLIDVPAGLVVGDTDEEPPEEPPARRTDDPHDHFIPPEPPRGPRLDWISRIAWLGLFGGPLLLIAAALLDFGTGRVTTIAVVGFVGGFLTLVLRMPDKLPPEDTPDDGAVV